MASVKAANIQYNITNNNFGCVCQEKYFIEKCFKEYFFQLLPTDCFEKQMLYYNLLTACLKSLDIRNIGSRYMR